jgi:hypothetical protein
MQYDEPTKPDFEKKPDFGGGDGFGDFGPSVLAGTYSIAVTVNGKTQTTTANVAYDPNQDIPAGDIKAFVGLALKARNQLSAFNEMLNRLVAMQGSLKGFQDTVGGYEDADKAKYKTAVDAAKALDKKLGELKDTVYNSDVQKDAPEDDIHYLAKLDGQLQSLFFGSAGSDPQPMLQSITDIDAEISPRLTDAVARFNALLQKDVPDYNKTAYGVGAPTLLVGDPVVIKPAPAL